MHARVVLGGGNVSYLERCPQFRGVLIESFHCIHMSTYIPSCETHIRMN